MALNLADLEEELKGDPKSRRFFDLAREYQKLGRLDQALELCERGLTFHPSQWQARILLAQLYLAKGRLEDARQMVEKVLLPLPDNVPANHLAADIYRELGEREKALRHFKIVELLEPGRVGVRDRVAELSAEAESPTAKPETEVPSSSAEAPFLPAEEKSQEESGVELAVPAPSISHDGASASAPGEDLVPESAPQIAAGMEPIPEGGDFEAGEAERSDSEVDWGVDTAAFDRSILDDDKDTDAFDAMLPQEEGAADEASAAATREIKEEWKAPEIEAHDGSEEDQSFEATDPVEQEDSAGMSTVTLAELYERQGYPEKAVEIYQRLLLREPDNQAIHDKIDQLMKRLAGEAPEGPPVQQEDVERALRRKRVSVLQDWLRRVREGSHV